MTAPTLTMMSAAPTGLQLAVSGGGLIGFGLVLAAWHLVPAQPDLRDALDRLAPEHTKPRPQVAAGTATARERLGLWAMRTLPPAAWVATPTKELAILRIPLSEFYGQKVVAAAAGLVLPPLVTVFFAVVVGISLPVVLPALATVGFAAAMFFLPDYNARDDAKRARAEFTRALGAYIDMVALERAAGSGTLQAMENAAQVGDTWVFRRLAEELARSRWSGVPPWEALRGLAVELGTPELEDLADILRLSGEHTVQIYDSLRARSAAMRSATLNAEKAAANDVNEQMTIPSSLLGVVFLGLLIAPPLLRVIGGTQ